MANRLRVMRKRRARSLRSKIIEYADLFNLRVALIAQDEISGEYEIFQSKLDKNFPPARSNIKPRTLHVGPEDKTGVETGAAKRGSDLQAKMRRIERQILQTKVPKPPRFQRPSFSKLGLH
ncbi:hypothetical protein F5Y08DRAFT_347112 [Xylaria arbuscula]|nr:hypothetical protein F5Y08DRAFT_347112 [Xylaria arbuscula]